MMLYGNLVDLNIERLKINQNNRLLLLYFQFDYKNPFNCIQSNLRSLFTFPVVDTVRYYNSYDNQCYCRKSSH